MSIYKDQEDYLDSDEDGSEADWDWDECDSDAGLAAKERQEKIDDATKIAVLLIAMSIPTAIGIALIYKVVQYVIS